jgi:dihydroorotase
MLRISTGVGIELRRLKTEEITMSISATFDQLLRGGRVICPASGIDGIRDVAIRNGKIAAVQPDILPTSAREVIDVTGKLVLPGLIDTHAHVYQYVTGRFGMNADMVGVQSGVTTLVDQGGPSCMTLPGFRHFVAEPSKSRVYAFLSAYLVGGLEGHYYPSLYSPEGVDIDATVKSATSNLDIVRGIKAHAEIGGFARWGIRVIEMAAEIGRRADLPVYVHFGQLWGLPESGTNGEDVDTILERVIPLLREGDVLAHPFTRHPGGFVNREGEVHPVIRAALDRGLKVDVGHGSHFSYRLAKKALAAGIVPTTLGADIHGYNTHVPAPAGTPDQHEDDENHPFAGQAKFSLVQAMSSMLALGLSLEQVVPMVTSEPAKMIGRADEIGALKVGREADVSVISEQPGRFVLRDNEKNEVIAERLLQPAFCLRAGTRYDAVAPILPQAVAA